MIRRVDFQTGTFYLGDCFDAMATLTPGSVDMVLNDPPYGTTRNKWDAVIPFEPMWSSYWRLLKSNGAAVLTASQPFTTTLAASQLANFKYAWVWEKSRFANQTLAKIQPLKIHEDVLVFCREKAPYFPQDLVEINKVTKQGAKVSDNQSGKTRPTEYLQTHTGYPRSIIRFKSEGSTIHPTQKPVALFEYLIRTYTNPGELVLDNTAGSGTTAIAAIQSGRRWICIERDPGYFDKAIARVWDAEAKL